MTAFFLVSGFFLVAAAFCVAFVTTVQFGRPPYNLIGWMLFVSGMCYLLAWIGGAEGLTAAIVITGLSIAWWYIGPVVLPPKSKVDKRGPVV